MVSTVINSDDGSVSGFPGLKTTGGDDGVLKLQAVGTDALVIAANGSVEIPTSLSVGNTDLTSLLDTAYSNAVSYADSVGNTAYSNAVSYTDIAVANLIDTAPEALDTLNELSIALNNDPDFANTVVGQITIAYTNATSYTDAEIAALGSMASQNSDSVSITGGSISGATGSFTTLSASANANFDSGTLFVDSVNNRVGVGTTSPDTNLHLYNSNGISSMITEGGSGFGTYQEFRVNNGTGIGLIGDGQNLIFGASQSDFGIRATNNLIFSSGGSTERMRIDSSGNLLVGATTNTTTPATLFVSNNNNTNHAISTKMEIAGSGRHLQCYDTLENSLFSIRTTNDDGNTELVSKNVTGFYTNGQERMRIDSSGNVLIGKTAFGFTTAGFQVEQSSGETVATRSGGTPIVACRLTSDGELIGLYRDSSRFGSIGASGGSLTFGVGSSATERMRIDSSGNVGIGTTSPGAKLEVKGPLSISSITSTLNFFPTPTSIISYTNTSLSDDHSIIYLINATSYTWHTWRIDAVITNGGTIETVASFFVDINETTVTYSDLGGFNSSNIAAVNGTTGTDNKFNFLLNGQNGSSYLGIRNRMGGARRAYITAKLISIR